MPQFHSRGWLEGRVSIRQKRRLGHAPVCPPTCLGAPRASGTKPPQGFFFLFSSLVRSRRPPDRHGDPVDGDGVVMLLAVGCCSASARHATCLCNELSATARYSTTGTASSRYSTLHTSVRTAAGTTASLLSFLPSAFLLGSRSRSRKLMAAWICLAGWPCAHISGAARWVLVGC